MHERVAEALAGFNKPYKVRRHSDFKIPIRNPRDFAAALGYEIDRITKTLFLRSPDKTVYLLAVCSVNKKAALPVVARHAECTRLEVAGMDELAVRINYQPMGVGPLGVDKTPIYLDRSLFQYDTILVGAGIPAVEIELSPRDLQFICDAKVLAFAG